MSKRKVPVTQDDEIFLFKSRMISESTKKTIEIPDFIKKIEEQGNNKLAIVSPMFKMAGVEFSIAVNPDNSVHNEPGFVGVYLQNHSTEVQMCSVTAKGPGVEGSWEMEKGPARKGWGWPKFLSHEEYRKWAKAHEDVFNVELVVTLHRKAEGDDWIR